MPVEECPFPIAPYAKAKYSSHLLNVLMPATPPGIVTPQVDRYLHEIQRPRDKVLSALESDAEENGVPIIGPLGGPLLSLVAQSCKAKNILEIGTATGYSGIWLGRVAAQNSGKLLTIERDYVRRAKARKSFEAAGIANSVEILTEDASEAVPRLAKERAGEFDVVFLDIGDKKQYPSLYPHCVRLLRVNGFFIADNTLWQGLVGVPSDKSEATSTIRKFNKLVYSDKRMFPVIVPLRDGTTVALKTSE